MLKWYAGFNIPDSTVQAAYVFIRCNSFEVNANTCTASIEYFLDQECITLWKEEICKFKFKGSLDDIADVYTQMKTLEQFAKYEGIN